MQKKWNETWKQIEQMDKELTELFESGTLSTVAIARSKKMIAAWNKLKKLAEEMDAFITPVEPLQVSIPFKSKEFEEIWQRWKDYVQEQHGQTIKSRSEISSLEHLNKISKGNDEKAIEFLRYAMHGRYKSFFFVDEKDMKQPAKEERKGSAFD